MEQEEKDKTQSDGRTVIYIEKKNPKSNRMKVKGGKVGTASSSECH